MVHIRKARAGNDSFGNEWSEDGAVVDVPVEQAAALMAIPDGGFSEAPAPKTLKQDDSGDSVGDDNTEVDEAPKPPARRSRKPKADAAAEDKTVEE